MRTALCLLALMCSQVPASALAQAAASSSPPVPALAALERMCSPRGAMQYDFGQTGVPGSSKLEASLGHPFGLPEGFAPFVDAQPRATEWSGRFMEMTYSVKMSKATAAIYIPQLKAALLSAGWSAVEMNEGEEPLYLMGYSAGATYSRPVGEGEGATRVLVTVGEALGELDLVCGRDDLLMSHAKEAFGELPPGTPRPAAPDVALPPVEQASDCSDPARLAALNAAMLDRSPESFMGQMMARATWRDRLTSWMIWKIDSSGKIDKDRLTELMFGSLADSSPGKDALAALETLPEMLAIVERLGKAEEVKDQKALCLGVVDLRSYLVKIDAITLRQTKGIQAALAAEAAKLGVSLD